MRKIFMGCVFSILSLFAIQVDDLTYESLANNEYTDHVQHFQRIFEHYKVNSFLEFGLGYGTKYFLDHCKEVTSCEVLLPGQSEEWFSHTSQLFQKYKNWKPLLMKGSSSMEYANLLCYRDRIDPALYDSSYILELKDICDGLFKDRKFDVVFVDPGWHMRGDLVNELFDRAPIIVAHNTNHSPDVYGWYRISTPSNYEKLIFREGNGGVTFWIRNDKKELIRALRNNGAMNTRSHKKLRVFFPQMHPTLVQSFALALQYLGHTLVLPGESFDSKSAINGPKLSYGSFFKKNILESTSFTHFFSKDDPSACSFLSKNVEVIESDEILINPPDVLFANCKEVEQDIYSIWAGLKRRAGRVVVPKIVHFSGNNNTQYDARRVRNLISLDAFTARSYNPEETNIICWIPWLDFDHLSFEGTSDNLEINTFLAHYYSGAFVNSNAIYQEIVRNCQRDFPHVTFNLYPKLIPNQYPYTRHEEVLSLMNKSCATIHIKESEGFGYTIVESLCKGRPVFLNRSFSLGSRMMNWCIEGKTAFFFSDYREFSEKLHKYTNDHAYRHQVQRDCAKTIRRLINNEKQARILDNFLQNLRD